MLPAGVEGESRCWCHKSPKIILFSQVCEDGVRLGSKIGRDVLEIWSLIPRNQPKALKNESVGIYFPHPRALLDFQNSYTNYRWKSGIGHHSSTISGVKAPRPK